MRGKLALGVFLLTSLVSVQAQESNFEAWKLSRHAELVGEEGWINLIGLLWMDEQQPFLEIIKEDSLGISSQSGVNTLGKFILEKDSVWFEFSPQLQKEKQVRYPGDKQLLFPVPYGTPGLSWDNFRWSVIQRAGKFALRLRDVNHPGVKSFIPTPVYDYDSKYRLAATFQPVFNETIDIPNVLGQVIPWKVMGMLVFDWEGVRTELLALEEAGKLFVLFSDESSARETYPTGRYLYVSYPDKLGKTFVDFNYSYNPPCAYTDFATCPIPPKVNRLQRSVVAGEKNPLGH